MVCRQIDLLPHHVKGRQGSKPWKRCERMMVTSKVDREVGAKGTCLLRQLSQKPSITPAKGQRFVVLLPSH